MPFEAVFLLLTVALSQALDCRLVVLAMQGAEAGVQQGLSPAGATDEFKADLATCLDSVAK